MTFISQGSLLNGLPEPQQQCPVPITAASSKAILFQGWLLSMLAGETEETMHLDVGDVGRIAHGSSKQM